LLTGTFLVILAAGGDSGRWWDVVLLVGVAVVLFVGVDVVLLVGVAVVLFVGVDVVLLVGEAVVVLVVVNEVDGASRI
jgi:hypothetical protein